MKIEMEGKSKKMVTPSMVRFLKVLSDKRRRRKRGEREV